MPFSKVLVAELNLLTHFNLNTTHEGIKVHQSATIETINAAENLFEKGLITQVDGGYLTGLGHDAAEHAQSVLEILGSEILTT